MTAGIHPLDGTSSFIIPRSSLVHSANNALYPSMELMLSITGVKIKISDAYGAYSGTSVSANIVLKLQNAGQSRSELVSVTITNFTLY
jgi:hypothetical protein